MRDTYYISHRNDVFTKEQMTKYIIAMTLGDGSLSRYGYNKNATYRIQQRYANLDYILYQATILSQLTKIKLNNIPAYSTATRNNSRAFYLATMSHPLFTTLYERMYHIGRKTITYHDASYIDAEFLSFLIQDDGSFNQERRRLYIATHSFSEPENKLLRDMFADKLNIHANMLKSNHRTGTKYSLWFNTKQTIKVIEVVLPYILPSFYYKLGLCPTPQTVTLWLNRLHNDGIVRSLLKDSELYRNVITI